MPARDSVLSALAPDFQYLVRRFLRIARQEKKLPTLYISSAFRTLSQQAQLHNKRTGAAPGESLHNYGYAFDIAFEKWGQSTDPAEDGTSAPWDELASIAGELDIKAGGEAGAPYPDHAHFEWYGGRSLDAFSKAAFLEELKAGLETNQTILTAVNELKSSLDEWSGRETERLEDELAYMKSVETSQSSLVQTTEELTIDVTIFNLNAVDLQ